MTAIQQEQLTLLRKQKKSYAEIAQITNMTVNTIRVYCHRHGLTDEDLKGLCFCEQCGSPIQRSSGKKKRFCSDVCRMNWWNAHQELVQRKAFYQMTCQCCGKEFLSYGNRNRKYCCRSCYIAGRYGKEHALNE